LRNPDHYDRRYLNDDFEGGETNFPHAGGVNRSVGAGDCSEGLRVRPAKGDALLVYTVNARTERPLAQHAPGRDPFAPYAGCAVASGTKWVANVWLDSVDRRAEPEAEFAQEFIRRQKEGRTGGQDLEQLRAKIRKRIEL
jgi:hypothetical protein